VCGEDALITQVNLLGHLLHDERVERWTHSRKGAVSTLVLGTVLVLPTSGLLWDNAAEQFRGLLASI